MAVEIDGKEFPKLSGKRGLFDSEAAWNGNKLAGLQQVNLFFIRLEKSGHSLHFIANQSPQLETIKIHKLNNQGVEIQSDQLPKIEPGNRRPWISIVLVNLPLEKIEIQASASQKQNSDDNDLQLKINGQRQINDTPKSHKYWYWCGRVLQGQIKTFEKELGLPRSLHYLELWADNSPTLKKMELSLKDTANQVQLYTYQGILENEDYNRYDAAIKTIVSDWSSEFLNQADPPSTPLDPDLVKAMIYVETRMGYYEDGTDEYPSYPDIMQVADPRDKAIHVFHDDGKENTEYEVVNGNLQRLFYPEASADTPEKSIKWGVRWLYHKAQNNIQEGSNWRREWVSWEKAVLGYGPGIKEYQERVWKIYRSGIAPQGNKLWSILLPFLLIPVLLFSLFALQGKTFVTFKDTKEAKDYQATAHILSGFWFQHLPLATTHSNAGNFLALDRAEQISIKYLDIDKDGGNEILISGRYLAHFTHYLLKKEGDQYRIVYHNSQFDTFREAFRTEKIEFLEFKDVEDDPNLQVVKSDVIPYSNAPDQLWTSYHSFNKEAGNYEFYKITKENLGEQISN
ncbi:MAG: hypothetical protein HYT66_00075 [Candidatus Yanofskybacteria bacterium]|nr:hypothetical protein [Candidatus Yanofskybacteria bacterium]